MQKTLIYRTGTFPRAEGEEKMIHPLLHLTFYLSPFSSLLPKLISGELRIEDAEKIVEEAE